MTNRIKVVTVEYETKDHTVWKAGVLAYNIEDAIKTIVDKVPNYDRPISTGMTRDVDVISNEVYADYFVPKRNIKTEEIKPKKVKKVTKSKEPVDTDAPLKCPFCERTYKIERTLLKHIKGNH